MLGWQLFHESLHRLGVRYIFGIAGREAEFMRAGRCPGPRWITVRHEFTAGVAAEVYARLTGSPQVAYSTFGPGALNLANGVASAFMDRSPLIAVSAQVETGRRQYGQTHQCVDQVAVMRPIVKYAAEPVELPLLPERLQSARSASLAEPLGPSFLSVPLDLFSRSIPDREARRLLGRLSPALPARPPRAAPGAMERLRVALRSARSPLLLAGNLVLREGAGRELAAFCANLGIPAFHTLAARGVLPERHPQNLGPISSYIDRMMGSQGVAETFRSADLILLAGFDPSEDVDPRMWLNGSRTRIIRLGGSIRPLRNDLRATLEIRGGLRDILAHAAASPLPRMSSATTRLRGLRAKALGSGMSRGPHGPAVNVVRAIREALGPGNIMISDVGLHKHYAGLFAAVERPGTFLTSNGLATFGFALPAAIGAQLARPRQRIVAITGDGGFHSGSQDLETLARLGLPVVVVVLADRSFGLIKHYQLRGGAPEPDKVDFLPVDFVGLARANGCLSWRAAPIARFPSLLRKALEARKPALIEVPIRYAYRF